VRKFDINSLHISPPDLYTVAALPCETQKVILKVLFIHIQIICVISEENKLLLPYHHSWKMSLHYLVKCTHFLSFSFFHAYWVPIRDMDELRKRCDFSTACWTMQLISGKEDWKHVSVQKVVTLNTCCNVACMTFHLPPITTGSFQSQQCQPTKIKRWTFLGHSVSRSTDLYHAPFIPLAGLLVRSLRMCRITWPKNTETTTYLESPTPICLVTIQVLWNYDDD